MLQSKKFWVVCLLLILTVFSTWFLLSGHSAPAYAKYIPRDAHGVLTINSKRLAADLLFGGTLKQDSTSTYHKKFDRWKMAIEKNGGLGINLTADVLAFGTIQQEKKGWYNGIVIKMEDEAKLIRFINKELSGLLDTTQTHMTSLIENRGYHSLVVVNDESESPVCIGFNKEALVMLRAGAHVSDPAFFNKELNRIFHLAPDSCILADENFRHLQHRSADLTFWYNLNNPLLKNLLNAASSNSNSGYVNAWLNFNKGETALEINNIAPGLKNEDIFNFNDKSNPRRFIGNVPEDNFMGLLYSHLNLDNLFTNFKQQGKESLVEHLFAKWGLTTEDISSALNGEVTISFNGIIHYKEKYIAYEYDDNFNQKEVERYREARIPGFNLYLGKKGHGKKNVLLEKLLENNQIVSYKKGFRLHAAMPVFLTDLGHSYYVSNTDSFPGEMQGQGTFNDRKEIETLIKNYTTGCFVDLIATDKQVGTEYKASSGKGKISEVFTSIAVGVNGENNKGTTTKITFKCADPGSNALVQLLNSAALLDLVNRRP
jgi:hypothetical protein